MDDRFARTAAQAANQYGAVSIDQLEDLGVNRQLRHKWVERGLLARAGPHSYFVAGSMPSWMRTITAAQFDLQGRGFIGGRSAARLHHLDGFTSNAAELITRREHRRLRLPYVVRSTSAPLDRSDTVTIDGIRCLTVERLILEGPLFGFTKAELENAIDSRIRDRRVHEGRLRLAVRNAHRRGVNGSAALIEAMEDTGGESRLERMFLAIVRKGGLPRPEMRRTYREGTRTIARIDAYFPNGFHVELEGHRTHSTRSQRQHDEERRTELTLRGERGITFTYNQVRDHADYVLDRLIRGVALAG